MKCRLCVLVAWTATALLLSSHSEAGVQFLAHFNRSFDADYSLCGLPKATVKDAKLTEGGKGFLFTNSAPSAECADIGYSTLAPKGAGLYYDAGNIDVRQGTIQMWVKTSWDWDNPTKERTNQDRQFLAVPLAGGVFNAVNFYFACDQGFSFIPHVAFYVHDGKRDYMCCARVGPEAPTDFHWQKDTWHYFVLTWTPRRMKLYADGKKLAEREFEVPMSLPLPEGPIIIGNAHRTYDRPANALIDEVRILDFPLDGDDAAFAVPTTELSDRIVGGVVAVGGPAAQYRPELRRYFAYRCALPPTLDGDLSDEAWQRVPAAGGFISLEGQRLPVPEQTEVKACHDDTTLYLAVRCHEDAMAAVEAKAKSNQDGQVFGDDAVEVFLSANRTGMPCLQLGLNVANVTCGYYYQANRQLDRNWKGTYRSALKKAEREWTLEIALPFSDLAQTPPKAGDLWRWNVCRDRRAGVGLQYSTMNFITSAFLSPEEYGELLFADQPSRPAAVEEASINQDYIARMRKDAGELASQIGRELGFVARVSPEAKRAAKLDAAEADLRSARRKLITMVDPKVTRGIAEWSGTQLGMKAVRRRLNEFAYLASGLGPAATVTIPAGLKPGVWKRPGYYLLASTELVVAVDASSGAVSGLWEKRGDRRLLSGSYDIYQMESRTADSRSDERMDRVESAKPGPDRLELVCSNPDLPGVKLRKLYTFASVGSKPRILCRRIEVLGRAKELTLLRVSSNAIFDREFRDKSYYDRIFVIGTTGDPRSQVWAREIKEPLMQRAWFISTEGRAQFSLVDPTTHTGLAEYLYKLNDRWVYPQGIPQSYWTPFGWEMGFGGTFLRPPESGGAREQLSKGTSFEVRYHLFHGDHLAFHREYLSLPEHVAVMNDWTPHPDAVRIRANGGGMLELVAAPTYGPLAFGAANASARPNEIILGMAGGYDSRWGAWPASDAEELVTLDAAGKESNRKPCQQFKQAFADMHRLYPRCRQGFYNFIADIHTSAPIYKQHPEWVLRDKKGNPIAGGYGPSYVAANWCPGFIDYLTKSLLRTVDYFGQDLLYLDFAVGSVLADWERGEVVQLHAFADFLKNLHAELAKRGKMLWLNSFSGQYYYDIGFHECDGAQHGTSWRNGAAINLSRKLYTRPGTACIPLYWLGGDQFVQEGRANEERYRNLILACGLTSTGCWLDPYQKHFPDGKGSADWAAVWQYAAAVHCTTHELVRSQFAEIGLSPAHWRDFGSEYETYTLKQGPAYLLNVISHKEEIGDATFTVDPKLTGFAPDKPVFLWQFHTRDPRNFPKQAPAVRSWDRMFERYECRVIPSPGGKLALTLNNLRPGLVRMAAITQEPAFLCSASGKQTQLLLPCNLGCSLKGQADTNRHSVRVIANMGQPGEVLIWFPEVWGNASVTAGGQQLSAEPASLDSEHFLKVSLLAGTTEVVVQPR